MQSLFFPKENKSFTQKKDSKTNLRDAQLAGKLGSNREEITAMVVEAEDSERVIVAIGNICYLYRGVNNDSPVFILLYIF
jgi:hypothetical protein